MAIGYTELDFVNGSAPALSAANLNHIDEALKDACDLLDANLPTAAGKAAADAIGAATGADTGAKIKTLVGDASTSNKGVALLGASGGAPKLTNRPDGDASPTYTSNFATTDGWNPSSGLSLAVSSGELVITSSVDNGSTVHILKPLAIPAGKTVYILLKASIEVPNNLRFEINTASLGYFSYYAGKLTTIGSYHVYAIRTAVAATQLIFYPFFGKTSGCNGATATIKALWVGDYSYLTGSLSEEAARIANELGDTAGVGVAAFADATSNLSNVSPGDYLEVGAKRYTWVTALTPLEGEVKIGADYAFSNENMKNAIAIGGSDPNFYCPSGANPLVTASRPTNPVLRITARVAGLRGNQITLAKSAATLTLSGSTLAGGKDAVGEKIRTQVENYIAGSGTRPAAAKTELTDNTKIGFEDEVDKAVGATLTFPAGGTWIWFVHGYGSNVGGQKKGSSAGGATITMAGANGSIWYRKYS